MYVYMYVYNYVFLPKGTYGNIKVVSLGLYNTSTCRFSWVAHQYYIIFVVWTCITLRVTINWLLLWLLLLLLLYYVLTLKWRWSDFLQCTQSEALPVREIQREELPLWQLMIFEINFVSLVLISFGDIIVNFIRPIWTKNSCGQLGKRECAFFRDIGLSLVCGLGAYVLCTIYL